jgi:hypothetical protein
MDFFWEVFLEMSASLNPNGFILINAPSKQPIHRYPIDSWRFYPDAAYSLAKWSRKHGHDLRVLYSSTIYEGDTLMVFWKPSVVPDSFRYDTIAILEDGLSDIEYQRSDVTNPTNEHGKYFQTLIVRYLRSYFAFYGHDVHTMNMNYHKHLNIEQQAIVFNDPSVRFYIGDVDTRKRYDVVPADYYDYMATCLCPLYIRQLCKRIHRDGHPIILM